MRSINPNEEGKSTKTDYDINVPGGILSRLLSEKNGLAALVEAVLNQVLDAQASEQVGAQRYERSEDRVAYRNGYRPRQLYTRIGPLTLRVPQMRDGQFLPRYFLVISVQNRRWFCR